MDFSWKTFLLTCIKQKQILYFILDFILNVLYTSKNNDIFSHFYKKDQQKKDFLFLTSWPQIRQGYPLNLSISLSGGKETN